jgi:DNA-binding NtrC family response regulator
VSLTRYILSVAPDPTLRRLREELLRRAGYVVTSLPSTSEALATISGKRIAFDIMIVCDCTPGDERRRLIAMLKATSPHTPVLVIGEHRELLCDDVVHGLNGAQALLDHVAGLLVV